LYIILLTLIDFNIKKKKSIEVRFNRQRLTEGEKINYARVLKKIITKIVSLNKGARLFREFADIEIRIIFK